jgi:lipid-binding SYLF domain-containing protein
MLDTKIVTDNGKIKAETIALAKGVAIFTGFRAGMYLAGAGGSGIVLARLPDGNWSPPSAFTVRSGSIGLVYGVDVYDCVCVLNTQAAVDAYAKPEINLAAVLALGAGPVGMMSNMKEAKPVSIYTKSRGLYGGLTLDGTVIKARPDANANFFGANYTTARILRGEVPAQDGANMWPAGAKQLVEALKMAEGGLADLNVIQNISMQPTSGNLEQ